MNEEGWGCGGVEYEQIDSSPCIQAWVLGILGQWWCKATAHEASWVLRSSQGPSPEQEYLLHRLCENSIKPYINTVIPLSAFLIF